MDFAKYSDSAPAFVVSAPLRRHPRERCLCQRSRTAHVTHMGRRSEKIKGRKEAQTRARTKVFARIGKMITMAAKAGGSDIIANKALADALEAARAANFPKDTVEKAIARATNSDHAGYKESVFEIYGHGGVGIYVDVLTDNPNRAAAEIRTIVNKNRLKIASPGSVAFNFERMGVIRVEARSVDDEDDLLLAAVDAGAEDCGRDGVDKNYFRVIVKPSELTAARHAIVKAGYSIDSALVEMIPKGFVQVSDSDAELNIHAMELLEDLDDVDGVYSNMMA